ncbi:putative secreted metalloprotease [Ixodes scapularis]
MRRTLLWSCPLLFLLLRLSASLAFEHTIVFPRLLESRDANGQKTLIVNDDITLQLTPSSVFAEEFTVDTVEDGSPVKYYFQGAEYERDLYYDNFHKASLTVNTHNGVQVEGLIGSTLRIKPANPVERSLDGHVAHMLYEVQRKESLTLKEKEFKTTNRNRRDISVPEVDKNTSYPIERRSGSYIAEVYLVVEKYYAKVFKYKESDILKYISRFINAANMYLNTIGSSSITVKVVGLDIRKTKGKFLMRMKKKKDKLLADETLQAFRSSFDKSKEYKEADLFMLMTRLDIAEGDEKSYDESVTGFSMVGGACTMYKAGSFEDEPFTYYGVYAFVREVSHLLGIVDDGKGPYDWIPGNNGAKKCPPTKGYIMGTPNAADPSVQYNHYYYSPCSANQFETFVSIKRNQDCLTTFNYKGPKTKIVPGVLPEDYNMKYFCKIMHDDYENVTYIDDAGRLKNCRFRCASPKDFRGRSVQFDHFMEEGAPCGKSGSRNMVCLKGACRQKK